MKNGEKVSFAESEYQYAKKMSSFILRKVADVDKNKKYKQIHNYALICFATICKMTQRQHRALNPLLV